jgi:hypothetical protein
LAVVPNDIGYIEDGPKSEWWRRIGHFFHVTAVIAVLLSVGFFVWGVIAVSRSIKYLGRLSESDDIADVAVVGIERIAYLAQAGDFIA